MSNNFFKMEGSVIVRFLVTCTALAACGNCAKFKSLESALTEKLLLNYNAQMRPPNPNYQNRTLVKLGMTLSQIISVKEKSQELATSVYMTHEWFDERFGWSPGDYDGITIMRLPPSAVWTPRIILQNSKDDSFDVSLMTNVLVHHNGNMEWLPPALYRSSCTIEVALFPFDWQNCTMTFKSATYDRSQMELGLAYGSEIYVDPAAFQPNGEWDLIQKPVRVNVKAKDELYQDVTFYFVIIRRPQFYVMNLILPCILMSSLSCFVFYLPSISCEKMTLSISILLGETVFLFLIAQRMPETSLAVPLIAGYLLFCMTLVILSVITSVIVCNVHYRSNVTHVMSDWVVKIFMDWLGPFLKVERPGSDESKEEPAGVVMRRRASSVIVRKAMRDRSNWKAPSEIIFDQQAERYGFRPRHTKNAYGFSELNLSNGNSEADNLLLPPTVQNVPEPLKPAVDAINYIVRHKKEEDHKSSSQDDWAYVARVLDYFLLWLYCAVFGLGTLAFFLQTTFADYPKKNS